MSPVQQAWTTVTVWVPPPLRLALILALALWTALRLVPAVLRLAAACLKRSGPMLAILTYPEFLTTSLARRLGRPLLPGTFAFGQLLGAIHRGLVAAGGLLSRAGERRVELHGWLFALPAALLLAVWYSAAGLPPGTFGDVVRTARTGLATTDVWLMDGQTVPPSAACPAVPRPPARPSAPKRTSKTALPQSKTASPAKGR
jgi:hypothetical protein